MRKLASWLAVGAVLAGASACSGEGTNGADGNDEAAGSTTTPPTTAPATTTTPASTAPPTTTPPTTTPPTTATSPATTTTTAPTTTASTTTVAPEPVRSVRTGGDSIALGLIPPLQAALTSSGYDFDAQWFVGFVFPDSDVRWAGLLAEPPDVLILFLAQWEADGLRTEGVVDVTDATWPDRYVAELVEPSLAELRATGTEVVWIGMPPTRDPVESARNQEVNEIWRALVEREPSMTWFDSAPFVAGPGGTYLEIDESVDPPVRLFQLDGRHLCPEGARRLAVGVLAYLADAHGVVVDPSWAGTDWADNPFAYGVDTCPAP